MDKKPGNGTHQAKKRTKMSVIEMYRYKLHNRTPQKPNHADHQELSGK
jgi:hypothetical protein